MDDGLQGVSKISMGLDCLTSKPTPLGNINI